MSSSSRLALFAIAAAGALPVAAAQAQYYGASSQPPLYPYEAQSSQPYAVQVAPGTYVIHRPAEQPRNYPYVRGSRTGIAVAAPKPGRFDRPHKPVDHALIEELRKRQGKTEQTEQANKEPAVRKPAARGVINTTKIVRDPPVVRETRRYVDDPPRIIERRQVVDDDTGTVEPEQQPRREDNKKRVIAADAEVTILGPDRMSIRLFRKGQGPKANAKAD